MKTWLHSFCNLSSSFLAVFTPPIMEDRYQIKLFGGKEMNQFMDLFLSGLAVGSGLAVAFFIMSMITTFMMTRKWAVRLLAKYSQKVANEVMTLSLDD